MKGKIFNAQEVQIKESGEMIKFLKQLFCKHQHKPIENNYFRLGWYKCEKCNKEKYIGDNVACTHFKLPPIIINK